MFSINMGDINSHDRAVELWAAIKGDAFVERNLRDAANGLLEAYFVTRLRDTQAAALSSEIASLKNTFGDCNALTRAIERVKAFRPRNPAFTS